jgi:excisionase family DNA binding protein
MDTPYLTKQELCEYLKVSRWIIEKLMRDGLPHVVLGRRVLFRREDVDKFMAARVVKN